MLRYIKNVSGLRSVEIKLNMKQKLLNLDSPIPIEVGLPAVPNVGVLHVTSHLPTPRNDRKILNPLPVALLGFINGLKCT